MAMLDDLQLADPDAIRQQARKAPPSSKQEVVQQAIDEPMMGLARAFSQFKDPWIRELVKGTVEARMSKALGYRVELPSEEDTQIKRMYAEKTQNDLTKQLAEGRTANARAILIDLDDKQKELLGFAGMDDPLAQDPDRSLMVLQKLGVPLTRGDLSLAKQEVLTSAEANRRQKAASLEATAKEGRERKSVLETDQFLGETVAAGSEGKGPVGQEFERIIEGVSKARGGADYSASFWLGADTDTDEAQGSAGLIDILRATREGGIGSKVGRDKASMLYLGRFGKDIADQLEGLGTDDEGRLLATSSDKGVEPEAAFNLQTIIRMLADDLGMAPADLMKQYLGLEYSGLDDASYIDVLTKMAGGDPKKIAAFLKESGIRIEATSP